MLAPSIETVNLDSMQTETLAIDAARTALDRCDFPTAERFGTVASSRALAAGDVVSAYAAQYVVGRALMEMGRNVAAVRVFSASHSLAVTSPDLEDKRATSAHNTFSAIVLARGKPASVDLWYSRAVRAYGAGHPRVAALEADNGYRLLTAGRPAEAAAVLLSLTDRCPDDARIGMLGHLAIACAQAGAPVRARAALEALRREIAAGGCGAAWGWFCDAKARHILGQSKRHITEAAAAARRLAARNGEESTRAAAAELLRAVS